MNLREDIKDMKQELEDVKNQSFTLEILHDYKVQNKRLFIIWIITFIALIGLTCYTVYLLNDIGVETTTTETIEIDDVDSIEHSNIYNR